MVQKQGEAKQRQRPIHHRRRPSIYYALPRTQSEPGTTVMNRRKVEQLLFSVERQTGDKRQHSPKNSGFFNRICGCSNISTVLINNIKSPAVIDNGSQLTTICFEIHKSLDPRQEFRSIEGYDLCVEGASGQSSLWWFHMAQGNSVISTFTDIRITGCHGYC